MMSVKYHRYACLYVVAIDHICVNEATREVLLLFSDISDVLISIVGRSTQSALMITMYLGENAQREITRTKRPIFKP
jgi:hypothetical protein